MPTTDERREVAARLREHQHGDVGSPTYEGGMIASWLRLKEALDAKGCDPQEDHTMMFGYLADLIEPEPERTCEFEPLIGGKKRCKRCGAFVSSDAVWDCFGVIPARFCPNCGAKVVGE